MEKLTENLWHREAVVRATVGDLAGREDQPGIAGTGVRPVHKGCLVQSDRLSREATFSKLSRDRSMISIGTSTPR
jgi:hypothetical protein